MAGSPRVSRGFTLIEVLIALAITALIATLSFSSLSAVLDSVEQVRESRQQINGMNRFWNLMSRDLAAVVGRPVRNGYGEVEGAFWGVSEVEPSLNFTRVGWHNPNRLARSNMQRIRYTVEDETLWRESYAVLDRADDTESRRVALLEGVLAMETVFLQRDRPVPLNEIDTDDWLDAWDPDTEDADVELPAALEIRIEVEGWGEIRRIYELPGK